MPFLFSTSKCIFFIISICIIFGGLAAHADEIDSPVTGRLKSLCAQLKSNNFSLLQGVTVGPGNSHLYLVMEDIVYRIPFNRHYVSWEPLRFAFFDHFKKTGHRLESLGNWKYLPLIKPTLAQMHPRRTLSNLKLNRLNIINENTLELILHEKSNSKFMNKFIFKGVDLVHVRFNSMLEAKMPSDFNLLRKHEVFLTKYNIHQILIWNNESYFRTGWNEGRISDYQAKRTFYFARYLDPDQELTDNLLELPPLSIAELNFTDASGMSSTLFMGVPKDRLDVIHLSDEPLDAFEFEIFEPPIFGFITPDGVQMWRKASDGVCRVYEFRYTGQTMNVILPLRIVSFQDYFVCSPAKWTYDPFPWDVLAMVVIALLLLGLGAWLIYYLSCSLRQPVITKKVIPKKNKKSISISTERSSSKKSPSDKKSSSSKKPSPKENSSSSVTHDKNKSTSFKSSTHDCTTTDGKKSPSDKKSSPSTGDKNVAS